MKLHELKSALLAKPSHVEKMALARKVGLYLTESRTRSEDREIVEEVAQALAEDISLDVRKTLAHELRKASELPFELADRIARDVAEVASPFLAQTEVFTSEALSALVREIDESVRITVARRRRVPSIVAVAIAESGGERSVTFLVRNPGAEMEDAASKVVERFSGNRSLMEHLSERGDLPLAVVDELIRCVSNAVRDALIDRYGLEAKTADDVGTSAHGASLVRWIDGASRGALNEYIRQLEERGALTDRLLVDVARHGGVRLLESVLAFRTGIDVDRIETILRKAGPVYVARLFHKAGYRRERGKKLGRALAEGLQRQQKGSSEDSPGDNEN